MESGKNLPQGFQKLMSSSSLLAARETISDDPRLLLPEVDAELQRCVRHLRRSGDRDGAELVLHCRGLLRAFREYGMVEGYLRLVADDLLDASFERVVAVVADAVTLSPAKMSEHLTRRVAEARQIGDLQNLPRLIMLRGYVDLVGQPDLTVRDGTSIQKIVPVAVGYVGQADLAAHRSYLDLNKEMLTPLGVSVGHALLRSSAEEPIGHLDLSTVRMLRQADGLLRAGLRMGLDEAYKALTAGNDLPELIESWLPQLPDVQDDWPVTDPSLARSYAIIEDGDASVERRLEELLELTKAVRNVALVDEDVYHYDRLIAVSVDLVHQAGLLGSLLFPPSQLLADALVTLAVSYADRFDFRLRLNDLRDAVWLCDQADDLLASSVTARASDDRSALVRARVEERWFQLTRDDSHLRRAVELTRNHVVGHKEAISVRARCLREGVDLGIFDDNAWAESLVTSFSLCRDEGSSDGWRANWHSELALGDLVHYRRTGSRRALENAWVHVNTSWRIAHTSMGAAAYAAVCRACADEPGGPPLDYVRGRHDPSALIGWNGRQFQALIATQAFVEWAAARNAPDLAMNQARVAFDLAHNAATHQYSDRDADVWAAWLSRLIPMIVLCMGALAPAGAAMRVERTRALMLSNRFYRDHEELALLSTAGHEDLAGSIRSALDVAKDPTSGSRTLDYALNQLWRLTDQVRELKGFAHFRSPIEVETLNAIANSRTLIYLVPGPLGGHALVHLPAGGWQHVKLPLCRTDPVPTVVMAYEDAVFNAEMPAGARRRAVNAMCDWLWNAVLTPLSELGLGPVLHIIGSSYLAYAPVHAARAHDDGPRNYALSNWEFRYVPSARALADAGTVAVGDEPPVFLGVSPPASTRALPGALAELASISEMFPSHSVINPEEVTTDSVRTGLSQCGWFHASCHGLVDPSDPVNSGLDLGGGERFSIRDVLDSVTGHLEVAVLSACQTNVPNLALPNEATSLAGGLVLSGCRAVIASSWPVPDQATSALMRRFYDHLGEAKQGVCQALAAAQLDFAGAGKRDPLWPDSWLEPYFWAGFTYMGP